MKTCGTLFQICLTGALLLALPAAVQAQFTWITNSGTITITGYTGAAGQVTIPDIITGLPVSSIGTQAFFGNSVMVNVMTGTNLTSIGQQAFQSCNSLTNIVIGTNVTSIGVQCFYNCSKLLGVGLPASISNIGLYAFGGCAKLTAIPVATANPNYSGFGGVVFNENMTTLVVYPGGLAGAYTIPSTVTSIDESAFWLCGHLTGITFPPSVTTIDEDSFDFCTSLTNVVIGSGVTTIGDDAFDDCTRLASITIPAGTTSIGQPLCYGCTSLTNITVNAANPDYITVGGVLFNSGQTILLQFPGGFTGAYVVTNSVTSVAYESFGGCPGVTTVYMPASVNSLGDFVFESCSSLTGAYFQGNVPPSPGTQEFLGANAAGKVYYFAGTTGWSTTFSGWPTVMLNPPQIIRTGIGVQNNQFGFSVIGTNAEPFLVKACTNLVNPNWQNVQTDTLNAATFNVRDLQWTNFPIRFYDATSVP